MTKYLLPLLLAAWLVFMPVGCGRKSSQDSYKTSNPYISKIFDKARRDGTETKIGGGKITKYTYEDVMRTGEYKGKHFEVAIYEKDGKVDRLNFKIYDTVVVVYKELDSNNCEEWTERGSIYAQAFDKGADGKFTGAKDRDMGYTYPGGWPSSESMTLSKTPIPFDTYKKLMKTEPKTETPMTEINCNEIVEDMANSL